MCRRWKKTTLGRDISHQWAVILIRLVEAVMKRPPRQALLLLAIEAMHEKCGTYLGKPAV